MIRSHCSVDFSRLPCGTALDLKILPSSVQGESGTQALVGLMRAFVDLGGIFMQTDVVDGDLLRDAQEHPDKYPSLSVRISGWSARFATLTKEWQDMIIVRTEHSTCGSRELARVQGETGNVERRCFPRPHLSSGKKEFPS